MVGVRSAGGAMRHYRCSNGVLYSDAEIWERLDAGDWRPVCWDDETGEEWMESADGRILYLDPVDRGDAPDDRAFEGIEG